MTFVTKDLDLVLFLNARNRIKQNCHEAVRNYIEHRRALYARNCNQEQETATHKKLRESIGVGKKPNWCHAFYRPLKLNRDLVKHLPWKLSPDRYGVPTEIYEKHKGAGGAYWPKMHTSKSLIEKPVERRVRYDFKIRSKNISWPFPGNARDRRPTVRCMVTSMNGCYRDPLDPGPTSYLPKHHTIDAHVSPPIKSEPPNPHIFLRYSCVPEKMNFITPKNVSMNPAPGRYEIRNIYLCPCNPKLIYMPGLKLFLDRQKRNRFRNLPYERIKARLFCDTEFQHVIGHGFRYLFKISQRSRNLKLKVPIKGSENLHLKLYHDQKYKDMLRQPYRVPISNPSCKMPQLPIRIRYNILSKRIIRKQLRSNKKIAFNSGQERWKDGYRLPPLTASKQQANKESLPLERQLRDQPVIRPSAWPVRPKLYDIPEHMKPMYIPELRKRLFKFLPLPGAKVLVTEQDTRPEMINGIYQCEKFYAQNIIPEHYFIEGIERRRAEEERQKAEMELLEALEAQKEQEAVQAEHTAKEERQSRDEGKMHVSHMPED